MFLSAQSLKRMSCWRFAIAVHIKASETPRNLPKLSLLCCCSTHTHHHGSRSGVHERRRDSACVLCVCMLRGVRRMYRAGEGESVVAWASPSTWWMPAPRASIGHHAGPQHQQHESGVAEAVRAETVEITRINCGSDAGGEGAPPFGPCTSNEQGARGHPHHDSLAHTSFVMVCMCSRSSSCTPCCPPRFRLFSIHEPTSTRSVERGEEVFLTRSHTPAHMYLVCRCALLLSRKRQLMRRRARHDCFRLFSIYESSRSVG